MERRYRQNTRSKRINGPLDVRFWAKVDKSTDCWEWMGNIKEDSGYGSIKNGNTMDYAHRVSWTLHFGTIPKGLCVLHKCDNRRCVNPNHLFLGTYKDNVQDMIKKGRQKFVHRRFIAGKVVCLRGHEKVLLPNETDKYVCRVCMNSWHKRNPERFKEQQRNYRRRRNAKNNPQRLK